MEGANHSPDGLKDLHRMAPMDVAMQLEARFGDEAVGLDVSPANPHGYPTIKS